jgi:RHS repeat-associated protein
VTLPIPNVAAVRRVRFTATADEGLEPGFAELEVIGSAVVASGASKIKWISDAHPMPRFTGDSRFVGGAVSIANLDGGPRPHVIVGASVFDADGHLLGDGRTLGGTTGGTGLRSAISAIADLDLDGIPEIVAGPTAYRLTGGQLTKVWQRTDRPDGYVAIGNLDDDPFPEIVIAGNGRIAMLNHDGTDAEVWNPPTHAPVPIPGGGLGGSGGSPTVADLDGDGIPEIGIAAAVNYLVFNRDGAIRWKAATSDRSSRSTGSTVFDFDGDGNVEVVYRDEVFLRVYRGADGLLLAKVPVSSATWAELPVVADVDNDGHADIVVTSDRLLDNSVASTGVFVLQDVFNKWTRTRRIWNQHGYHVTNVDEDGTIPAVESPHWLVPGLNSFRLNAFLPGESPDQTDSFTYRASDGTLQSNIASVRITVRTQNSPPRITSTPVTSAATGLRYLYAPQATDPDAGDVLTFSLPTAPAGMTIDPSFGLIQWTPTPSQLGAHEVVVKVQDVHGAFGLQGYTVEVASPVTVPDVVGQPQAAAEATIQSANLAVGAITTRNSPTVPVGSVLSQNPSAGTLAAPGSAVNLIVSLGPDPAGDLDRDGDGFTPNQGDCDDTKPTVHPGAIDIPGNDVDENCDGADAVDPRTLDGDGDGFSSANGDCDDENAAIHPGADDVPGNGIDEDCNGADSVADDEIAPTASILSPADGAVITMPTGIIGTAADDNFLRYRLEFAGVDAATGAVLGFGTAPVVNGLLGSVDPTLLENGLYRVRLIAEDVNGEMAIDERVYRLSGEAKVGLMALSFVDLQVPVSGIPITVIRSYDSRVKERRDFGIGWDLAIRSGKYQHNRTPGQGWTINDQPFLGSFLPCIGGTSETRSHLTEVRLSDREVYTFALTVSNGNLGLTGACEGVASFRFLDGTTPGATLEILGGTSVIYLRGGADEVLDMNAFLGGANVVYNPQKVRLTTLDGRKIEFARTSGITRIEDLNGNALSITAGGIVHSSGESIAFLRDESGRITRITDPKGHTLNYGYDTNGDLTAFRDEEANLTTFVYDARHNLLEIHDPLGNRAVRSEYDGDGRLVAVIDAQGNRQEVTHDIVGRREIIRDRLGRVTVHTYDENGNITSSTDTLGHTRAYTYDADGNILTMVDPIGNVSRNTFDARGFLLTQADPLGNTSSFTFDASGRLITATDPAGFVAKYTYDSRGNVTSSMDALGAVVGYTYNSQGDLTSITDSIGGVLRNQYDTTGNITRQTDSLGHVATFTYDSNGNQLKQGFSRTAADGNTVAVILQNLFNPKDQLIGGTDPEGGTIAFAYNGNGEQTMIRDRKGFETRYQYDVRGNRTRSLYPDGTIESSTYDANGNRVTYTDRLGRTSRYERDGLNRVIQTTRPDGGMTRTEYDALGRVFANIDPAGSRSEYFYDAAGRQTKIVDALGGQTVFGYDPRGLKTSVTDANGNTKSFQYDGNRRLTRVILPDGTFSTVAYDIAGRRTAITDQGGNVTRFEYDATGHLTKVIDPLNAQTIYGYDELGNLTSMIDANGNETRWAYDNLRRLVKHTLPLGMSETFGYDSVGNVASKTDFLGRTETYSYDEKGGLAARTYPDGTQVTYVYTTDGKIATITDSRGATTYAYDILDRLVQVSDPNGETIRYGYDARGNRVSVETRSGMTLFAYDALNRLTSVTDAAGGTTRYAYDPAGNRTGCDYPNGTRTEYAYDSNNRLTRLRNLRADSSVVSSYIYSLGASGERIRVTEDSGRRVDYTYDPLYRLVREEITDATLGTEAFEYTYDAVGNRLSKAGSQETLTYSYDVNARLLSDGVRTYAYDLNGNTTAATTSGRSVTTYSYDFDNRLIGIVSDAATSSYVYDANGVRVASNVNGIVTEYLVDRAAPFSRVLEEREGSGALRVRYEYGDDLVSQWRGGVPSYYLYDGLGTTRVLTDGAGAATDTYTYDAFGVLLGSTGSTLNNYLFTGEEFDGSGGFYYLRARYYNPATGRFLTRDLLEGVTEDPQSLHKYLYCKNNPVNCIDPSGNMSLVELGAVVAGNFILVSLALQAYTTVETVHYLTSNIPKDADGNFDFTGPDAIIALGICGSLSPSAIIQKFGNHPIGRAIALGLSFVSGAGGVEVLHRIGGGSHDNWAYGFWGISLQASLSKLLSNNFGPIGSVSIYHGLVWQMKTPEAYEGAFLELSGTKVIRRFHEGFPYLQPNINVFTGPSLSGASYGFSVNSLNTNTSTSLSAARTWYFRISEHTFEDVQVLPALKSVVPSPLILN